MQCTADPDNTRSGKVAIARWEIVKNASIKRSYTIAKQVMTERNVHPQTEAIVAEAQGMQPCVSMLRGRMVDGPEITADFQQCGLYEAGYCMKFSPSRRMSSADRT